MGCALSSFGALSFPFWVSVSLFGVLGVFPSLHKVKANGAMEPHSGAGFSARRTISFTLLLILLATPVMGMDLHYFPSNQDAKRRATGFVDSSNFTANEVC